MLSGMRDDSPSGSAPPEGMEAFPFLAPGGAPVLPLSALRQGSAAMQRESSGASEDEPELDSKTAEEKSQNEAQLAKVYESFHLDELWAKLGESLARLRADPSSAQVLLPIIESLMLSLIHI